MLFITNLSTVKLAKSYISCSPNYFFHKHVMASGGLYSLIFSSQFTVLNNHLCALDTTLRILIT